MRFKCVQRYFTYKLLLMKELVTGSGEHRYLPALTGFLIVVPCTRKPAFCHRRATQTRKDPKYAYENRVTVLAIVLCSLKPKGPVLHSLKHTS